MHKNSVKDAEWCLNDVQYNLDGARSRAMQLISRVTWRQEQVDLVLRQVGWLQAGLDRLRRRLAAMLQVELVVYLNFAFAAQESRKTEQRSRLSHYVSEAVPTINNALHDLLDGVNILRVPPPGDNYRSSSRHCCALKLNCFFLIY